MAAPAEQCQSSNLHKVDAAKRGAEGGEKGVLGEQHVL